MIKVGQPAPDFPIADSSLRALLAEGPVVLFFFPKVFTSG
jgi:peroxiredoxin